MKGPTEVTVWSLLAEDAAGCVCLSLSSSNTIGDLLLMYCSEKGIQVCSNYVLCNSANKLLHASKSLKEECIENGDVLILTASDRYENIDSFGNWWMVTGLSLFIGVVGLIYVFFVFLSPVHMPEKHGIVIDAGSSHSHLFVFKWHSLEPLSAENLRIVHECYMPGGITNFRSKTHGLLSYFEQCLHEAKSHISQPNRHKTPLILGATAGMRLLRQYDPDGANRILAEIRRIFSAETSFEVKHTDIFIVSGQKEGINGWTAVNYLFNSFLQDDDTDSYLSALDVGGASVQVSTYIDEPGKWPTVNVSLFNETYSVCSKSFMCYGVVKAQYRYEYFLTNKLPNESSSVVLSPCLPSGTNTIFTKRDVSDPCILSDKDDINAIGSLIEPKEIDYFNKYVHSFVNKSSDSISNTVLNEHMTNINNNRNTSIKHNDDILYTMQGASNPYACKKEVQKLFNYKLCNKTFIFGDCLNREHVPPYTGELVGFSSIFFYIFPLLGISKNTPLHDFEAAVMKTCSKDYSALTKMHPDIPEGLIRDLCFDAMYVYTLLTDGLAITPHKWKNILFAKQVKNQDVVWALGLMLNRTSVMPLPDVVKGMEVTSFAALTVLFSACLFTSLLLLFNTIRLRNRNSSYERVLSEHVGQKIIVNA